MLLVRWEKSFLKALFVFFIFSSLSFAEDTRNTFLSWLSKEDPVLNKEIIEDTNQKFRAKYGLFKTRFSDFKKTEWDASFLDLAEESLEKKTGKTITELCNTTNAQLKSGISTSISRFSDPSKSQFSSLFSTYLSTNLALSKAGRSLGISEANEEIWKNNVNRIAANESMGGNAGDGAVAVNFLFDKMGRIVFVGNFQDASEEIKAQYASKRLTDGTVRYAVDKKVWQLFTPSNTTPALKDQLSRDLARHNGAPPQASNASFQIQCNLALRKLMGR
ncbi:hypothetical protein EBQ74_09520 [bacterium]|nr:hypothetical protein [bacterium]